MSDAATMMRYEANKKSAMVAYVLWFFFGCLGAHRFYLGRSSSAVAMLLIALVSLPLALVAIGFFTFLIVAIWALIDAFLIPGMTADFNNRLVNALA